MRTTKTTTTRPTVGNGKKKQYGPIGNSVSRDANLVKKRQSGPTSFKEKMTNERSTPSKRPKAKPTSVGGTKAQRDPSILKNLRGRIK